VRLHIRGHHLPGLRCGPYDDVHVGLQVRRDPEGLVPGDADRAEWVADIRTVDRGMPRCARLTEPAIRVV
jgi:hypothetical protein